MRVRGALFASLVLLCVLGSLSTLFAPVRNPAERPPEPTAPSPAWDAPAPATAAPAAEASQDAGSASRALSALAAAEGTHPVVCRLPADAAVAEPPGVYVVDGHVLFRGQGPDGRKLLRRAEDAGPYRTAVWVSSEDGTSCSLVEPDRRTVVGAVDPGRRSMPREVACNHELVPVGREGAFRVDVVEGDSCYLHVPEWPDVTGIVLYGSALPERVSLAAEGVSPTFSEAVQAAGRVLDEQLASDAAVREMADPFDVALSDPSLDASARTLLEAWRWAEASVDDEVVERAMDLQEALDRLDRLVP